MLEEGGVWPSRGALMWLEEGEVEGVFQAHLGPGGVCGKCVLYTAATDLQILFTTGGTDPVRR